MKKFLIFSAFCFCGFIIWAMMSDFIALTDKGEHHLPLLAQRFLAFCQTLLGEVMDFFQTSWAKLMSFLKDVVDKAVLNFKDWVNEY